MATVLDVGDALAGVIAAALYPNGTNRPCAAGVECKVFMGWPAPAQLDRDMAAKLVNISIWPRQDEKNTNNSNDTPVVVVAPAPTLTMAINGQQVTVGGTVSVPQIVSVTVQNKAYPYQVLANDNLTTIATALAALLQVDYPATTSSGSVITLPGSANLQAARVGAQGTTASEQRRQQRTFQVTVWAATPAHRAAVAGFVDRSLSTVRFIDLSDHTKCRLAYQGSTISDELEKTVIYRYDFMYMVDYSTVLLDTAMQVVNPQADSQGSIIQQVP